MLANSESHLRSSEAFYRYLDHIIFRPARSLNKILSCLRTLQVSVKFLLELVPYRVENEGHNFIAYVSCRNNSCGRWKSGGPLVASDSVSTESISDDVNEQQQWIHLDSGCKTRQKDDYKNEDHNDSELVISDFWHDPLTDKRGAMEPLLGFSGSTEDGQRPLSVLFLSNNLSATDCKVKSETHAGRVSASQPQDWTHSETLRNTLHTTGHFSSFFTVF